MEEPCVCHPEGGVGGGGGSLGRVGVWEERSCSWPGLLLVPGQNKAEFEAVLREIKRFGFGTRSCSVFLRGLWLMALIKDEF